LPWGAPVELPAGDLVGRTLAGGPADPAALERPARGGGRRGGSRSGGGARRGGRGAGTSRSGAGTRRSGE
ncbi:MAG TPA: hypothetical protein VIZ22_12105, partial [Candidatus Limnocylindrales bacterium]